MDFFIYNKKMIESNISCILSKFFSTKLTLIDLYDFLLYVAWFCKMVM